MSTILIWDDEDPAPAERLPIFLWRAFASSSPDQISIPAIVETRADALRARFLAWIYEIGEWRVNGRAVVEHLEVRPGFSMWWMTLLSHKPNYYQTAFVTDVIKCLAFEEVLPPEVRAVKIHTRNPALRELMRQFCSTRGVDFSVMSIPDARAGAGQQVKGVSSWTARARGWLLTAWAAFQIRSAPVGGDAHQSTACVFDMLVHLRNPATGIFRSQYWTGLNDLLANAGVATTWVHTFYRHHEVPSLPDARALISRFNATAPRSERHTLLDRLSTAIVASTLRSYIDLLIASLRLREIRQAFTPQGSCFDFWPLFRSTWWSSVIGKSAVRNCLTLAQYESFLSELPHQATGIYLKENQPWEMALLHAWRAAGHGRIIGVPHSTVRFWDLRYFYDRRSYARIGAHAIPMPDEVAVNGPVAQRMYLEGGFPADRIAEVEALRYSHIVGDATERAQRRASGRLRVLVCGDNIHASNMRLIELARRAAASCSESPHLIFKPHKAAPVDLAVLELSGIELRRDELPDLMRESDLVITGNLTSAAVDAYCVGKSVASSIDGASLNGSPLRGLAGVRYFSTVDELIGIFRTAHAAENTADVKQHHQYFWLDPELPRWRRMLNLDVPGKNAGEASPGVAARYL